MKSMTVVSRVLLHVLAGCAVVGMVACGQSTSPSAPTSPTATVTAVTVTSTSTSASSFQLTATARFSDGTTKDVTSTATWESSNVLVASVSSSGVVTVLATGEVDVKATYQGVAGTQHLLVAKLPPTAITITGVPTVAVVSFQATASARLSDGSSQDVTRSATWESSNAAVATVSTSGFVSLVANGETDIQATYSGLTTSAHLKVTIPQVSVVSGVVTDASTSKPLADVRVQLVVGGSATTDAQGAYKVTVTQGRVLLEFSKAGYQTLEKEIDVSGDMTLSVALSPTTTM